ncbi:hypothetical protein [Limnospira platensis]|uniref:Uncharacterized protein n=3 Tax=Limnospira TaxID=2596745 RepID=A0A5M3TG63_LIMPL|nr:hypothetical protein [Arthrospira platensis]AMW29276.1 hypothetical protein AP285_16195 [Arthrospira platensis YZ]MBD2672188.1 hypothetical protein [Arthrospira platensis FACHB-439]MBD2713347.1 hypothetical protein [Arthrospira platensis FACHB-835]MDF2213160.1 hypothetical protein [Arthrospira platensis NCB002]BAI91501.1 hypothetical protein NIES39_J04540 [Arthrospira platensis NIES-39]
MPLNDAYNKYKDNFVAKLGQPKGTCLGRSLNVEAPVDKTSKYVIPMPMLLLHTLSSNSQGLEPTEVRDLTVWKPAPRGNTGTSNANRRKVPAGLGYNTGKKTGFYRVFVEGPARPTNPGIWREYTTTGANSGTKKLRFITLKVPNIFSINCLLYVFAHYWTMKPISLRTHHKWYQIPDKNDYPLDGLGELTTGRTEAANQKQGDIPANYPKGWNYV